MIKLNSSEFVVESPCKKYRVLLTIDFKRKTIDLMPGDKNGSWLFVSSVPEVAHKVAKLMVEAAAFANDELLKQEGYDVTAKT
jgi:hypothetical protein